jgi:hypothetical protein
MLSEIGDRHERLFRCLHTWCNSWRNDRPFHMIETIILAVAIGVFICLLALTIVFLIWTKK